MNKNPEEHLDTYLAGLSVKLTEMIDYIADFRKSDLSVFVLKNELGRLADSVEISQGLLSEYMSNLTDSEVSEPYQDNEDVEFEPLKEEDYKFDLDGGEDRPHSPQFWGIDEAEDINYPSVEIPFDLTKSSKSTE